MSDRLSTAGDEGDEMSDLETRMGVPTDEVTMVTRSSSSRDVVLTNQSRQNDVISQSLQTLTEESCASGTCRPGAHNEFQFDDETDKHMKPGQPDDDQSKFDILKGEISQISNVLNSVVSVLQGMKNKSTELSTQGETARVRQSKGASQGQQGPLECSASVMRTESDQREASDPCVANNWVDMGSRDENNSYPHRSNGFIRGSEPAAVRHRSIQYGDTDIEESQEQDRWFSRRGYWDNEDHTGEYQRNRFAPDQRNSRFVDQPYRRQVRSREITRPTTNAVDLKLPAFTGKDNWQVWISRSETIAARRNWD